MSQAKKVFTRLMPFVLILLVGCVSQPTLQVTNPLPTPTIFPGLLDLPTAVQNIVLSPTQPVVSTPTPVETAIVVPTVTPKPVVQVDINRDNHPISPLIYGLSGGELDYLKALRPTLLSWGGNPSTRYNWKLGNAWNAGSDWMFKNGNYGVPDGISANEEFIKLAQTLGMQVRLAVPTLGWVAKDRESCSFPNPDGSCGNANGANCKEPGTIADPQRANVPSDPASIVEWIDRLKKIKSTPRFIAMDNEPELWGFTHYDVHPECTTYEEVLEKYLAYATALRSANPGAELAGPVACCWYSYWNTAPGPVAVEADMPTDYIAWFLKSMQTHDEAVGQRNLDVLDVHFYPQGGVYNQNTDPETNALRLRSTRALWDPTYIDESWIDEPIYFIPRMRELIDQYYPGTRLGISEWNFGADDDINGALAIADVLGIFGREDVYYAAYWRFPPPGSPGFYAFKMYTNYDDQGSRFGGASVPVSSNDEDIASYAAIDDQTSRLQIMLINKRSDEPISLNLEISDFAAQANAVLYRYAEDQSAKIVKSDLTVTSNTIPVTLPASSISLIVLSAK
jgi:hypothetical protein